MTTSQESPNQEDPSQDQYPDPGKLADDQDELGWNRDEHGRMKDYAADDDAVVTVRED